MKHGVYNGDFKVESISTQEFENLNGNFLGKYECQLWVICSKKPKKKKD